MSQIVLDSSVILAVAKREPINPKAFDVIASGVISTVNLAEVLSKLREWNADDADRGALLIASLEGVEPFTLRQAQMAAELIAKTSSAGLSLGDRACLALAPELGAEVYTVDRAWARVDAGCKINLLR